MIKNITKILLVVIIIFSVATPAQAGMFDWLKRTDDNYLSDATYNYSLAYLSPSNQLSSAANHTDENADEQIKIQDSFIIQNNISTPVLKNVPKLSIKNELITVATAYSSTPDQTDDSPFITALGTQVRDGIVAANFLPFGTKIKIPSHFGDKIFVVEDRMNKRFSDRIDIWYPDRESAKQFGVRTVKIQVLE